jgi:hypothetical protein
VIDVEGKPWQPARLRAGRAENQSGVSQRNRRGTFMMQPHAAPAQPMSLGRKIPTTKTIRENRTQWDNFARTIWGRTAVVFGGEYQWPRTTPDHVFDHLKQFAFMRADPAFRRLTRDCRALVPNAPRFIKGPSDECLPQDGDPTFASYSTRLLRYFAGRDFLLIINDFNLVFKNYFRDCVDNMSPALRRLGVPIKEKVPERTAGIDMALFLGRARQTPCGIHRDPNHNFMIPVLGSKTIRGWDEKACSWISEFDNSRDYAGSLAGSTVLSAVPGQVIYWPPSFWHIAEAKSSRLSLALAIGIFHD